METQELRRSVLVGNQQLIQTSRAELVARKEAYVVRRKIILLIVILVLTVGTWLTMLYFKVRRQYNYLIQAVGASGFAQCTPTRIALCCSYNFVNKVWSPSRNPSFSAACSIMVYNKDAQPAIHRAGGLGKALSGLWELCDANPTLGPETLVCNALGVKPTDPKNLAFWCYKQCDAQTDQVVGQSTQTLQSVQTGVTAVGTAAFVGEMVIPIPGVGAAIGAAAGLLFGLLKGVDDQNKYKKEAQQRIAQCSASRQSCVNLGLPPCR